MDKGKSKFDEVTFKQDRFGGGLIDRKYLPSFKAMFAMDLMKQHAIVAAHDDGEDSQGRAKLSLTTPEEIVDRACAIADLAVDEFEKRGWFIECPQTTEEKDR